jgi:arabinofuranosyltransferase
MDFSTSGLENPLSHLLIALFFIEHLKSDDERRFDKLVWYAALAITNRMDLVWLFLPALAYDVWKGGEARKPRAWIGLAPFVGWEIFSLLYYGFLFPNTAYAKLGSGVHLKSLLMQGECYLLNSLSWDPITLFSIVGLLGIVFFTLRDDRRAVLVAVGIVLSLVYTVRVGGDYMTGRFLTAPLFASMFLLARIEFDRPLEFAIALALLIGLALYSPRPPIQMSDGYVSLGSAPQGIDDEHGYRHNDTSLLRMSRGQGLRGLGGWVADGVKANRERTPVAVYRNIGYYGYFAGPEVHVIDPYGIGDPLMARMPFPEDGHWSPGHFYRDVPDGYVDAAIDKGTFADPALAAYWAKLKLVTRGPIFDGERLKEIVKFNLGLNPMPPIPPNAPKQP